MGKNVCKRSDTQIAKAISIDVQQNKMEICQLPSLANYIYQTYFY